MKLIMNIHRGGGRSGVGDTTAGIRVDELVRGAGLG